jgi:hypothetical protein
MPRKSPASITISPNVRCNRIYPVENTKRNLTQLQTVGFRLTAEQAIHFARVLLAVAQDWDDIEITGRRFERRKSDGTYPITVTSYRSD